MDIPVLKFDELNLLPRVVFALGGVVFVVEVFRENWCMAVFGAAISMLAVTGNFALGMVKKEDKPLKWFPIMVMQCVVSATLAIGLLVYAFYFCGAHYRI